METSTSTKDKSPRFPLLLPLWIGTLISYLSPSKVEAVPFLYLVPLVFLILSLLSTALEFSGYLRQQKLPMEGGKTFQIEPSTRKGGWIMEVVIHFWPKKLDEAEKKEVLSKQTGLFSLIFGSKELGPLTFYFNFPSNKPNPQSITWACTSFLGAALNSKWIVQWCGGDGLGLSFLRALLNAVQLIYAVDHSLHLLN